MICFQLQNYTLGTNEMIRSLTRINDRNNWENFIVRIYEPYVHKVFYSIFREFILSLYLIFQNYFIYDKSTIA